MILRGKEKKVIHLENNSKKEKIHLLIFQKCTFPWNTIHFWTISKYVNVYFNIDCSIWSKSFHVDNSYKRQIFFFQRQWPSTILSRLSNCIDQWLISMWVLTLRMTVVGKGVLEVSVFYFLQFSSRELQQQSDLMQQSSLKSFLLF